MTNDFGWPVMRLGSVPSVGISSLKGDYQELRIVFCFHDWFPVDGSAMRDRTLSRDSTPSDPSRKNASVQKFCTRDLPR